jgi:hypothetical protein
MDIAVWNGLLQRLDLRLYVPTTLLCVVVEKMPSANQQPGLLGGIQTLRLPPGTNLVGFHFACLEMQVSQHRKSKVGTQIDPSWRGCHAQ